MVLNVNKFQKVKQMVLLMMIFRTVHLSGGSVEVSMGT